MCHSFARCVPIAGGWWRWCWQRLQEKGDRGDGRWENPQVKSSPFSPSPPFGAGIGLGQGRGNIVVKGSCLRPLPLFLSICRRYSLLRYGTGTVHFFGGWRCERCSSSNIEFSPCTDCSESWGVELDHGALVCHRFPRELKKKTISTDHKDNLRFPQQKLKER